MNKSIKEIIEKAHRLFGGLEYNSDESRMCEQFDNCTLTRVASVYSEDRDGCVSVVFGMPDGTCEVSYEWRADDTELAALLRVHDVPPINAHRLSGVPILVQDAEGDYSVYPLEQQLVKMYAAGTLEQSDIDSETVKEEFDVALPWESGVIGPTEITAEEGAVYSVVDSVR